MHANPSAAPTGAAAAARGGDPLSLALALQACRQDTLSIFAAFETSLPGLQVPLSPELNPPLWELGHIGWFQEYWIARQPQRHLGCDADPQAARRPGVRANADALYHSGQVAHDSRWHLPLPDAAQTRHELARQLEQTLALLAGLDEAGDPTLYFFRLALLHEDMHHEAALYMAQSLGLPVDDPRWQAPRLAEPGAPVPLPGGHWTLGVESGRGFAFDNELGRRDVALGATEIDAQVLRWCDYLPFVDDGGYEDARHWTAAGWRWRTQPGSAEARTLPRYLGREAGRWQHWRHGRWRALDLQEPACHLSWHEAMAWCRWAGRRLPSEAEWEWAALHHPQAFRWGDVWEWTSSPFAPFPGFRPHPYRDYSAPWFDGRPVLRGASYLTQPRMRHPRFRNFFTPQRNDVPAGLRTCAL